ncbi:MULTISPECIES: alpha/beta fold hydrolase [unclassified Desulfovibrio]|nr:MULTISPECIES: alpha/beta fold hydrolase [Bacteria]
MYGKINTVNNLKANVIIVHGLAEYMDRYDELTTFLNDNQFNVIRYDQRGHGRSEGKTVYYNNELEETLKIITKDDSNETI